MASTSKNALANLLGSMVGPIIGLLITPFYQKTIGLEGIGLIGQMMIITMIVSVLVAGVGKTYQKELTKAFDFHPEEVNALIRGGLIAYIGIAVLGGILFFTVGKIEFAHIIAAKQTSFTKGTLDYCLWLMTGYVLISVVSGAASLILLALRDQVWISMFGALSGIMLAVSAWLAIRQVPKIETYYIVSLLGSIVTSGVIIWRCFYVSKKVSHNVEVKKLTHIWRDKIATQWKAIIILIIHEGIGAVIAQLDTMWITHNYSDKSLGAYNQAARPANIAGMFSNPINIATYPELCKLSHESYTREQAGEYLGRINFVLTLLFASSMVALIPSVKAIYTFWLGTTNLNESLLYMPVLLGFLILIAGKLLLAIAGPAYNLTVANNNVKYGITKNVVSIIILPIWIYFAAKYWHQIGVASSTVIYALICIGVCNYMAFKHHASFYSALRWTLASSACIGLGAVIAYSLSQMHLTGIASFSLSCISAILFIGIILLFTVGRHPKRWLHLLEIDFQTRPHSLSTPSQAAS